jgi:phosphoserine phosphatase RsbU/P
LLFSDLPAWPCYVSFASELEAAMHSLFPSRERESRAAAEPVPTAFPAITGAEVAAVFVGQRVAGDFYDAIRVSPERVLIGLLDVAELNQENRAVLSAAQEIFRTLGTQLFSGSDINESEAMIELNLRINRGLIETSSGVRSCPAFIACYHEKFGTLCYTNDGHTPALLRDSSGITELDSTGLPLGLFSHATSDARIVALEKAAALLLVSHGVVSCEGGRNGSSEQYGLDRIKQLLKEATISNAQSLCASVLNSVAEFTGHAPACDDRTALALLRTS